MERGEWTDSNRVIVFHIVSGEQDVYKYLLYRKAKISALVLMLAENNF